MIDPIFMDNIFNVILKKEDIRTIIESLESYEIGQVLDEMSIYLKEKMLLNDRKFELYMFDRFYRIIADSKQLLNMNSDSGFVLILTLSKMVEAVNLKTIDEVIKHVENAQIEKSEKKIIKEEVQNVSKTQIEREEIVIKDENQIKYKKLIDSIYEKSYELGECFEKSFKYSSYENNILKINSSAQGECKVKLYKNFSHIKMFVANVFGINTQLDFEKIQKKQEKETARIVQSSVSQIQNSEVKESKIDIYEQPSSCVGSMSAMKNPTLSQADLNIDDVLNSRMTSTIMKLFQSSHPPKIKSKL